MGQFQLHISSSLYRLNDCSILFFHFSESQRSPDFQHFSTHQFPPFYRPLPQLLTHGLLQVAGVAAFFGASTACAAFVNQVSDGIAQQLAEFGADLGLVAPRRWRCDQGQGGTRCE